MATKNWANPGTSGNWNVDANWGPVAGVPVAGDDVTVGGSATPFVVTLDIATTGALGSLTLGDAMTGNVILSVGSGFTVDVTGGSATTILQGPGTLILLTGGQLNSTNIAMAAGAITGFGAVNATNIVSPSSLGVLQASGGPLAVSGTIAAGVNLQIDSASASILQILGTATSTNAIDISNVNQTLQIGAAASLTINANESITNGSIQLQGGVLNLGANTLDVGTGATVSGAGTITASNISGSGTIAANGGTLVLTESIAASAGTQFGISIASTLQLGNDGTETVGTGNVFQFFADNAVAALALANDNGFSGTISQMDVSTGAVGTPTNAVVILNENVSVSGFTPGTTGSITLSDGAVLNLASLESATWFPQFSFDGTNTTVWLNVACYCRGTMIRTDQGEVPVEDLAIGDQVVTASGEARPIKWIGRRGYDGRFVAGNRDILPVRIEAGALGDGVPARDLLLSPEHALVIDGLFFPARMLVNGVTIRQLDAVDAIEYFHIELDTHDVIFAEAATAETFTDFGGRGVFQNREEFNALYPDAVPADWEVYDRLLEAAKARLPEVREALLARAAELGRLTRDPDLRLLIDGQAVRARVIDGSVYRFAVRAGASDLTIASRNVVPAETESDSLDPRRLGVPLERVSVFGDGARIEMSHESPALCDGFHANEESHRWTNGRGALPPGILRHVPGELLVEVQIGATSLHYPADECPDVETSGSEAASERRLISAAE